MKKISIVFAIVLAMACKESVHKEAIPSPDDTLVTKNDDSNNTKDTVTDPIAIIKKQVERINTIPLQKKHYEFVCDEKMMVDFFYDNDEIVKIAVDFGTIGDTYAKEGYYYHKGKFIFKYEFVEGGPACEGCISSNDTGLTYRMIK